MIVTSATAFRPFLMAVFVLFAQARIRLDDCCCKQRTDLNILIMFTISCVLCLAAFCNVEVDVVHRNVESEVSCFPERRSPGEVQSKWAHA